MSEDVKHQPNNQDTTSSSAVQQSESSSATVATKTESDEKAAPLAPPPKPSQQNNQQSQPQQTPDYFGGGHNGSHFSLEPNPFEQSFGNPSSGETPGRGGLPGVTSLTSPAPLGPGSTPRNWQDSLRSGPLSPAMLQGPVNNNNPGYFDQEFRNNYPTPNESSLRTGLTPGGGGSMFPAPSPNTQALFNNLNGGGQPTPGTAEFQRAAAAAARKPDQNGGANGQNMSKQEYQPAQQQGRPETFGTNQQEHEAVNSLYMLAQPQDRNRGNANQFAVPQQGQNQALINANMNLQQRMAQQQQQAQQQQSPTHGHNLSSNDMSGDDDGDMEEEKPSTRSKGKRGSTGKGGQAANGRRKAEDTPSKAPPKKRSRGNTGESIDMEEPMSDDNMSIKDEGGMGSNGKKMTDEEKRKNFLERNRVAALKCRQRKKQWLANLQTKVEIFTQENDALTQQCGQLREEVINLKTLLLAHKDCAVSHQQGLGGNNMAQFMSSYDHMTQHGMGMPQMQAQGMPQGMNAGVQRG